MNIRRPALKRLLEERDRTIGLLFRLRGPGIPREKRVVLVAALADVLRLCRSWAFRSSALSLSTRRGDSVVLGRAPLRAIDATIAYDMWLTPASRSRRRRLRLTRTPSPRRVEKGRRNHTVMTKYWFGPM